MIGIVRGLSLFAVKQPHETAKQHLAELLFYKIIVMKNLITHNDNSIVNVRKFPGL